jgi:ABC-type polysaccharide/polyol phosphate export permease
MLPERVRMAVTGFNPLYFYIAQFRHFVMGGGSWKAEAVWGAGAAIVMLAVGLAAFSRTKNKFILYM